GPDKQEQERRKPALGNPEAGGGPRGFFEVGHCPRDTTRAPRLFTLARLRPASDKQAPPRETVFNCPPSGRALGADQERRGTSTGRHRASGLARLAVHV